MNKLVINSFLIVALAGAACSGKKESADQAEWPEMDAFHMLMAESFHTYEDSADLGPAKANAAEMASQAAKWAETPLPEKVDNDEVKGHLANLKTQTASFAALVQSGTDEEIGQALTNLHDLFHSIQAAWHGAGHGAEHGHKH